ncbi:hypothetical protein HYDPIDRAFT_116426 [Hydnomerulius pinastri MD-312]|uniref:Uncharacterized protein n=1 Tax=Hydnomerulius pinastri MD-312 TaxID=994086 RepID=A0A0C9WBV1_9AGAM|nr:hypothetical protein HYDPIDRAFT_116426 [Hydnomerulius pinastri MD-312]
MTESDRQNSSLRAGESALDAIEKQENPVSNQIRDEDLMEERIVTTTNETIFCPTVGPIFEGSSPGVSL